MQVETIITGAFETNTYILTIDGEHLIIDPSGKKERIITHIDGQVDAILLTHGHFDHIKAVDDLHEYYGCPIYMNASDADLVDPLLSKTTNTMGPFSASISSKIDFIKEGKMKIGPFSFEVVFTPGHTKGSVIYIFDDMVFTGDTLFKESVGRTDLYGGSDRELKMSLRILKELDADYLIYPGHGPSSKVAHELLYNPFLK